MGAGPEEKEGCRRRLAPEERRAEVLQAALEVFGEVGFERATLQDVAERAGVTKGALYHYFDSKDQLFLELMRERVSAHVEAAAALVAAAEPTKPREVLLRELLESMWANMQQPGMPELMKLMLSELPKFPECARSFFDEIVAPARRTMRQALDRAGAGGDGRAETVDTVVALLPSMMLGVGLTRHVLHAIDPSGVTPERAGAVVVEVLLRGALATVDHAGPA
jgi:AcrR family transcriptional regulator